MKTAVLLGATGLVGSALLKLLIDDREYDKVIVIVRNQLINDHPKVEQRVIDFDKPEEYKDHI